MPKKVEWGGAKRQLTDVQRAHNIFLVSEAFRNVVEQLEPNVHQIVPVELVWSDGSHAASFYWFYPCNRIDSMDRHHTTHELSEGSGLWMAKSGNRFVVSLKQVAGRHIWIDPRMNSFDLPFVSEVFKQAMGQELR